MNTSRKYPISSILFLMLVISLPILIIGMLAFREQQENGEAVYDADIYRGTIIDPPLPLDDFQMPASTGDDLSLSSFYGKWVLLFFGFTHCPDICPTTLAEYAQVMRLLGETSEQIQVVFISVDSERDTPSVLANYVTRFNPTFIGLQGTPETLEQIQEQFGLWYEIAPHDTNIANYTVDHSARTYLIDPQGRLRISYSFGTEINALVESIQQAILGS